MQKAIIVEYIHDVNRALNEINDYLSKGWKVVSNAPMSGSAPMSGMKGTRNVSLVILEKDG
ncbi:MAG: hypothetical protein ACFFD4_19210 [Candidatus Odinarchaeota archaeon]